MQATDRKDGFGGATLEICSGVIGDTVRTVSTEYLQITLRTSLPDELRSAPVFAYYSIDRIYFQDKHDTGLQDLTNSTNYCVIFN